MGCVGSLWQLLCNYIHEEAYYMKGAKYKFKVQTDHKNLEYFMKVQKLNRRQAHQALYLSRFDFTLKHVPGTKIGKADGLSR